MAVRSAGSISFAVWQVCAPAFPARNARTIAMQYNWSLKHRETGPIRFPAFVSESCTALAGRCAPWLAVYKRMCCPKWLTAIVLDGLSSISLQETKGSTFLLLGIFLVAPGPVLKS